ncbi:unnamed protein product [Aspergillus oryzae]|uniref:Unnamed protein product n=2 Tax=Aspergillus oryzae TaxID=5062 RepID=A0AAN5BWX4_ASPOZ|nr:unnamed protein product [Aspergillus oryzae]GMF90571.1 unnamed protein product [Aspergillus oryzae]GMG16012.1 unnamed protein product [Aspergillus oryzae]GMG36921.1 unnamed protein product [Aspergillus oryzae]GMG54993.1 unnamed protein product [Aspergillus oryzae var. brunneus]
MFGRAMTEACRSFRSNRDPCRGVSTGVVEGILDARPLDMEASTSAVADNSWELPNFRLFDGLSSWNSYFAFSETLSPLE